MKRRGRLPSPEGFGVRLSGPSFSVLAHLWSAETNLCLLQRFVGRHFARKHDHGRHRTGDRNRTKRTKKVKEKWGLICCVIEWACRWRVCHNARSLSRPFALWPAARRREATATAATRPYQITSGAVSSITGASAGCHAPAASIMQASDVMPSAC